MEQRKNIFYFFFLVISLFSDGGAMALQLANAKQPNYCCVVARHVPCDPRHHTAMGHGKGRLGDVGDEVSNVVLRPVPP